MNTNNTGRADGRRRAPVIAVAVVAATAILAGCQTPAKGADTATETRAAAVRPAHITQITPADRAERIITDQKERRQSVAERLPGATADRLERELGTAQEQQAAPARPRSGVEQLPGATADRLDRELGGAQVDAVDPTRPQNATEQLPGATADRLDRELGGAQVDGVAPTRPDAVGQLPGATADRLDRELVTQGRQTIECDATAGPGTGPAPC